MEVTSGKDKGRQGEGVENVAHIYGRAGRVVARSFGMRWMIGVQLIDAVVVILTASPNPRKSADLVSLVCLLLPMPIR